MSDLAEIRAALQDIRDKVTVTATDVTWIKGRSADQEKDLDRLKSRVDRQSGQASIFGAIAGSIFAGAIAFFTRAHT